MNSITNERFNHSYRDSIFHSEGLARNGEKVTFGSVTSFKLGGRVVLVKINLHIRNGFGISSLEGESLKMILL